jgi:hypothetical protein
MTISRPQVEGLTQKKTPGRAAALSFPLEIQDGTAMPIDLAKFFGTIRRDSELMQSLCHVGSRPLLPARSGGDNKPVESLPVHDVEWPDARISGELA